MNSLFQSDLWWVARKISAMAQMLVCGSSSTVCRPPRYSSLAHPPRYSSLSMATMASEPPRQQRLNKKRLCTNVLLVTKIIKIGMYVFSCLYNHTGIRVCP